MLLARGLGQKHGTPRGPARRGYGLLIEGDFQDFCVEAEGVLDVQVPVGPIVLLTLLRGWHTLVGAERAVAREK